MQLVLEVSYFGICVKSKKIFLLTNNHAAFCVDKAFDVDKQRLASFRNL